MKKSKYFSTYTTTASKYIPKKPRVCINWNPPFHTSLHKIFKNCFLLSKSCFTMFTFRGTFTKWIWVWKGGISIDADSGPLGYVCRSRSWEVFPFFSDWLLPYCERLLNFYGNLVMTKGLPISSTKCINWWHLFIQFFLIKEINGWSH